jgi:hypothetical protein
MVGAAHRGPPRRFAAVGGGKVTLVALSLRVRFAPNMRMKLTGALAFRLQSQRSTAIECASAGRPQLMRHPLGRWKL